MTSKLTSRTKILIQVAIGIFGVQGCAHDRGVYETLRKARSPDGKKLAQLIQRSSRAALTSDTYYLVLSSQELDEGSLKLAYHLRERPALDVTNGRKLLLHWRDAKTLEVICNACGLEKIDVMTKEARVDGTDLRYLGFPAGTAYD